MKGRLSLSIQKAMVPTLLHHTTELPTTVVASAEARRALEAAFSPQIAKDALETARLLITELVTNSVRHAVMPPGSVIRLEIDTNAARLRVEVHDAGRVITDLRPTEHPNEGRRVTERHRSPPLNRRSTTPTSTRS